MTTFDPPYCSDSSSCACALGHFRLRMRSGVELSDWLMMYMVSWTIDWLTGI